MIRARWAKTVPPRTPRVEREHAEQAAVVEWVQWNLPRHRELELLFAIPNGGHRHPAVAGKLRAEGVKSGVPDLCLPVARCGAHGLYIEMKAPGGRERPEQKWWRERLRQQGYHSEVCVGADAAITTLKSYLEGQLVDGA